MPECIVHALEVIDVEKADIKLAQILFGVVVERMEIEEAGQIVFCRGEKEFFQIDDLVSKFLKDKGDDPFSRKLKNAEGEGVFLLADFQGEQNDIVAIGRLAHLPNSMANLFLIFLIACRFANLAFAVDGFDEIIRGQDAFEAQFGEPRGQKDEGRSEKRRRKRNIGHHVPRRIAKRGQVLREPSPRNKRHIKKRFREEGSADVIY